MHKVTIALNHGPIQVVPVEGGVRVDASCTVMVGRVPYRTYSLDITDRIPPAQVEQIRQVYERLCAEVVDPCMFETILPEFEPEEAAEVPPEPTSP